MVSDTILGRTSIMYEVNSKQGIPLDVGRPKARQRDGNRDESFATFNWKTCLNHAQLVS